MAETMNPETKALLESLNRTGPEEAALLSEWEKKWARDNIKRFRQYKERTRSFSQAQYETCVKILTKTGMLPPGFDPIEEAPKEEDNGQWDVTEW